MTSEEEWGANEIGEGAEAEEAASNRGDCLMGEDRILPLFSVAVATLGLLIPSPLLFFRFADDFVSSFP